LPEYYQIQKGEIESLIGWLDKTWHADDIDVRRSEVHRQLVELDFPIIYTTNYDRWIERAYAPATGGSPGSAMSPIWPVSPPPIRILSSFTGISSTRRLSC
jgi:hypothetical protein